MASKNLTAVKASANTLRSACNVVFGSRHAHERNDEVLERIYIGRRFENDTERLEKLFELYTNMKVIERLAHDLRAAFPDMKGFSPPT